MSEAIRAGRISAKGSFNLFLGMAVSNLIMAVGTVIIGSLLGDTNYGIYATALIPFSLFTLFRDFGINSAMIKYVAQYRAENRTAEIRSILASGMLFKLISGVLLSIVCFLSADFFAVVYGQPEVKRLIEIVSITILTGSLITTAQSAFTGFERMEFNSLILAFQSAIKSVIAILLVFAGYGTLGAIFGHIVAFVASGVLAALIFLFLFYRSPKRASNCRLKLIRPLILMLK